MPAEDESDIELIIPETNSSVTKGNLYAYDENLDKKKLESLREPLRYA